MGLVIFVIYFEKLFLTTSGRGEGECKVTFFSANHWDGRNRAAYIESATPCHDAQVVGSYRVSNPLRLIILASKSEDCITATQQLQDVKYPCVLVCVVEG